MSNAPENIETSMEKRRVLVVDDEKAIRENISEVLSFDGEKYKSDDAFVKLEQELFKKTVENNQNRQKFEIVVCSQGADAVEIVKESVRDNNKFSIIFLDIRMPPGMNGVSAAEIIRKIDPDVYIVFVTGYSDVDPAEISLRVPPQDKLFYIEKPLHRKELEQIANALATKWYNEKSMGELINILKEELATAENRK